MNDPNETSIVPNMTVSEAIELYEECCREVREAFETISQAKKKLQTFGEYIRIGDEYTRHEPVWEDPARVLAFIERNVWAAIVDRMGIRQVMSIEAREKLDKQLDKGDMPPLTAENVIGMMRGMHAKIPEMAEAAIREVWEWLPTSRGFVDGQGV